MSLFDNDKVTTLLTMAGAGSFGAIGRSLFDPNMDAPFRARLIRGACRLARRIVVAVVVGPMVGMFLMATSFDIMTKFGIVTVAGMVADELVLFVINAASHLDKDDIVNRLATRFIGPKE